jgi:hypothetical protein
MTALSARPRGIASAVRLALGAALVLAGLGGTACYTTYPPPTTVLVKEQLATSRAPSEPSQNIGTPPLNPTVNPPEWTDEGARERALPTQPR